MVVAVAGRFLQDIPCHPKSHPGPHAPLTPKNRYHTHTVLTFVCRYRWRWVGVARADDGRTTLLADAHSVIVLQERMHIHNCYSFQSCTQEIGLLGVSHSIYRVSYQNFNVVRVLNQQGGFKSVELCHNFLLH